MPTPSFSLESVLYTDAILRVKNGDIALFEAGWKPSNLLISRLSASPYCHAGMLRRANRIITLLETIQWCGGREVSFEDMVRDYPGQWVIYRPHKPYDGSTHRSHLVSSRTSKLKNANHPTQRCREYPI